MPLPDLSHFSGLDPAYFRPSDLETVRHAFADTVTDFAATCRDNRELIDGLTAAMPPDSGLIYPQVVGVGSCRRTYVTSFGLVLKLTRHDDLEPEELEWRGGRSYLPKLRWLRHNSNWNEIYVSACLPNAAPRIYGAALSFASQRPSVIISEAVRPLNLYYPDDTTGVLNKHLHIRDRDGSLIVSDPRFSREKPLAEELPLTGFLPTHEEGIWLGNLGRTADGRFVVLDLGGYFPRGIRDELDAVPHSVARDKKLSEVAMSRYRAVRKENTWHPKPIDPQQP